MANEVRVVLVSDPTPEFPKNKNNSFKVRLPIQLPLTGPGWKVALHSISLPHTTHRYPDRLVDNDVKWPIQFGSWGNKLSDHGEYVWSGYATRDVLLNSADGIHMMKLVQSYMHANVQFGLQGGFFAIGLQSTPGTLGYTTLESNIQSTWEGDDFVILRRRPINITACNLEFRIELRFAERMRWIAKDDADKYYIMKGNLN